MYKIVLYKLNRLIQISSLSRKYYRSDKILNKIFSNSSISSNSASLDIGSGPNPRNPFGAMELFGVDLRPCSENNVQFADLTSGALPFDNERFDFVTAFDVIEHIPRVIRIGNDSRFPFVELVNEVFRILKPNGIFFSLTPCFPFKEVFQDPTHVNFMTEDTLFQYFCEPQWARIYGYNGSFSMVVDGWVGSKYFILMKKSGNQPVDDVNQHQR
jgi:SAM-dependent methyltransferase